MKLSLCLFLSLSALILLNNGVDSLHKIYPEFQSLSATDVQLLYRTGYHFQPTKNWMNDPNGPMYYKGYYHLFYQYNPNGSVWGNIVWAHSVSQDLINWKRLDAAIYPSQPFDKFGCWSGSATVLPGGKPIILYTGITDEHNTQVQNYAIPANLSDPLLTEWVKPDNNPLIVPDRWINKTAFRDPTTAWLGRDGLWRITISGVVRQMGIAHLYKSRDFTHWVKAKHPLHAVAGTGNWECPEFFPVSESGSNGLDTSVMGPKVKHVLKISLDDTRYEYYTIGTYYTITDRYIPDEGMIDNRNGLRYDYGNFYASKSFFDPSTNRRIVWGWANESDSVNDDVNKGWSGIQLIPRTISLDPNGKQLLLWPIKEIETLRANMVELNNKKLVKGEMVEIKGITVAQADVEVTFSFDSLDKAEPFDPSWDRYDAQKLCKQKGSTVQGGIGPFGLLTLASKNLEEYTPIFFRVFKALDKHIVLMCSDATRSSLNNEEGAYKPSFAGFVNVDLTQKKLSLRSLIDHSVVESFGVQGKTCITSRVYPALAIGEEAHLFAFNNGTQSIKIDNLKGWTMNKPENMNQ
ncbi:beta-fructofuranosidase, insoluble isoenzyme 1-like [Salvia splendens]|uniref:beta-fructofuranosidase, insoluble isoenzyme 1-like n=1 Tax=Salvia splendens TaxID=180675 RepID=UPI001C26F7E3|nr:beta-fructofuranosidase, insoluble isoenzyme 1-like [Salvia splendens]